MLDLLLFFCHSWIKSIANGNLLNYLHEELRIEFLHPQLGTILWLTQHTHANCGSWQLHHDLHDAIQCLHGRMCEFRHNKFDSLYKRMIGFCIFPKVFYIRYICIFFDYLFLLFCFPCWFSVARFCSLSNCMVFLFSILIIFFRFFLASN